MAAVPAPIAGGAAAGTGPKARVLASADVRLDGLLDGGIRSVLALDRVAGPRVRAWMRVRRICLLTSARWVPQV